MAKTKKDNKDESGSHFLLNSYDGEDGGDKTKRAGPGEYPVGESEDEGPGQPFDFDFCKESIRQRTGGHAKYVKGDPDEESPHKNTHIGADIAKHPAKQGTENSDDRDGNEKAKSEENGITCSLLSFDDLVLTSDITDYQWNGSQMTGAEKNADRTPEETAKASEKESLAHPGIDRKKKLIHELLDPQLGEHGHYGLLIQKALMPIHFLAL